MTILSQLSDFEYRSEQEINGLPLVHINVGSNPGIDRPLVAKGVVAIGNVAYGIVAIGGMAFGLVTLAGLGLGMVSLGGIALGLVALGAFAMGYEVALGAVVQSAQSAIGVVSIDSPVVVWSFLIVTVIAMVMWGTKKAEAARLGG